MTFWVIGLLIPGVASTVSAVNFSVTIINMRAPGMTLLRMPMFVWMSLIMQFLLAFCVPGHHGGAGAAAVRPRLRHALLRLRSRGGDPVLWQHLFWLFGHPEVYILILPAFGIVSEILPVFSRKPLFGYQFDGVLGIAHRLPRLRRVGPPHVLGRHGPDREHGVRHLDDDHRHPDRREDLQLARDDVGRRSQFTTPMLFALGFVAMFIIGGLSGVMHASPPADHQQTDTYFIVAHFHYVLFGGAIFGLFAGMYYWWPKCSAAC